MLFKMSESNVTETYVKSEVGRTFRLNHSEGDQIWAEGQVMGPIATKLDDSNNSRETVYYGISIPKDVNVNGSEDFLHVYTDKTEALKVVKKFKKARFKAFKTRHDAVKFAIYGSEILTVSSPAVGENLEVSSPVIGEKPSPFKGPKTQDLVRLRRVIECGDIPMFRVIVWDNPRYLVSSGDTPAILQEGCRYNALHVAAKAKNAEMCDLILRTVGDKAFVGLLYGEEDAGSCYDRAQILVDLYLNTPDKALNETPLHFAVKFGAVAVAETLLSYPQCDKTAKNKLGQTPKDVICSRVAAPDAALRRELASLLGDRFYVPVLRSEDNSEQPTVGEPFSPACPLVLKANPITPRMEIRAYAGPMGREEAKAFRKKWKTSPRTLRTPVRNSNMQTYMGSPNVCNVRLQDTEKGLERVGRILAKEFKVGWNEYWPFLDTFTNLASEEGLQKLEEYLKKRYHDTFSKPEKREEKPENPPPSVASGGDGAISPMSDLCLAFKACSLSDGDAGKLAMRNRPKFLGALSDRCSGDMASGLEEEALHSLIPNPGLSPFLYVEKSCQVFAKRISDGLNIIGRSSRFAESILDMLRAEVRHLQDLIYSFKEDGRFISVDFNLVHSRISAIVASKLSEMVNDELEFIISGLKSATSPSNALDTSVSDDEDGHNASYRNMQLYTEQQKRSDAERAQVLCIAENILSALEKPPEKSVRIKTEKECIEVWSDAMECMCLRQSLVRNTRKGSSFKRSHSIRYTPYKTMDNCLDGVPRRLTYDTDTVMKDDSSLTVDQFLHHKADYDDESDEELFATPPTSPEDSSESGSEDEMGTPEEGLEVYINGDAPSKLDIIVMQAIEEATFSPFEFPNIHRWRHSVLLHSEQERIGWQSPSSRSMDRVRTPERTRCLQSSTPPQKWHKITGPYSPLSPQR